MVLCSGKIYWELLEARRARASSSAEEECNVALVRVEELFPFPLAAVRAEVAKYEAGDPELVWCQEEPRNCGAFNHVRACLLDASEGGGGPPFTALPRFVGRPAASSAAGGVMAWHRAEQQAVIKAALE